MWHDERQYSYLRVKVIDFLNGQLNIARVNGGPDFHPFLNALQIWSPLNIGLDCKLLCSGGISISDEIVHDQVIDVTEACH